MNRSEQKEVLRDMLADLAEIVEKAKENSKKFESTLELFDALPDAINELIEEPSIDIEDAKAEFVNEYFESLLEPLYDGLTDFRSEIEEYMSEVPEHRLDALEERYMDLDDTVGMVEQSSAEYVDMDTFFDAMSDVKVNLKAMYK